MGYTSPLARSVRRQTGSSPGASVRPPPPAGGAVATKPRATPNHYQPAGDQYQQQLRQRRMPIEHFAIAHQVVALGQRLHHLHDHRRAGLVAACRGSCRRAARRKARRSAPARHRRSPSNMGAGQRQARQMALRQGWRLAGQRLAVGLVDGVKTSSTWSNSSKVQRSASASEVPHSRRRWASRAGSKFARDLYQPPRRRRLRSETRRNARPNSCRPRRAKRSTTAAPAASAATARARCSGPRDGAAETCAVPASGARLQLLRRAWQPARFTGCQLHRC